MKLNRVRIFTRLSAESALNFPRGRNGRGGNILSNARLTVPSLTLAHDHDFDGARTPIEIDIDPDAGFVLRNTEVKDGRTDALIEDPVLDKSARDPNKHDVDTSARLKKNLANKIFGNLARCELYAKLGLRFWILVG